MERMAGPSVSAMLRRRLGLSRKSVASTQKLRQIPPSGANSWKLSTTFLVAEHQSFLKGGQRHATPMLPHRLIPPLPHFWNLKPHNILSTYPNAPSFHHSLLFCHYICFSISWETSTPLFLQHSVSISALCWFHCLLQIDYTQIPITSPILQPISLDSLPPFPKCPHHKILLYYLPSLFLYSNCWVQLKKIIQHHRLSHDFQS